MCFHTQTIFPLCLHGGTGQSPKSDMGARKAIVVRSSDSSRVLRIFVSRSGGIRLPALRRDSLSRSFRSARSVGSRIAIEVRDCLVVSFSVLEEGFVLRCE